MHALGTVDHALLLLILHLLEARINSLLAILGLIHVRGKPSRILHTCPLGLHLLLTLAGTTLDRNLFTLLKVVASHINLRHSGTLSKLRFLLS